MMTWSCKCGKAEYFGSGMTPLDCEGCEECGTNYRKEPIKPHNLKLKYNEDTGKPSHNKCVCCYERVGLDDK
jgi:hypothetical protein